ncbi:MAG: DUF5107 domain-containing protein, partial [Bacteroidetes bacterium]|nr:DUF5107 domain-containing protein [Bacteroidota bacterium]
MRVNIKVIWFCIFAASMWSSVQAQEAKIYKEKVSYRTYGFSDPNPVVQMHKEKMNKVYPYFRFDGFEKEGKQKEWEIIVLENDYIKVLVAPEIGGKVLGAIKKSTGNEFLYYNKVIKFRDIASRGAWTSGGIEFNFGSIGHTPMVSTPVDYFTRSNEDGSVSCFIGTDDLSSRTRWTVEVRLPKDKAFFETNGSWHNGSELETSMYHWSNAAAEVSNDLKFYYPGNKHISHGGEVYDYPVSEEGRDLSRYANMNFGGSKSLHISGKYTDFFGGYYENKDFGFIHWCDYTEKPGKKKFMWSLARDGEIWKDLLTDPDLGNKQYFEYQSGLMFNQANPGSAASPYKHLPLLPNMTESFSEAWFPVVGAGGISMANKYGTIYALERNGYWVFNFCPIQEINSELKVKNEDELVFQKKLNMKPMQLFTDSVKITVDANYEISIGNDLLVYSSKYETTKELKRPTKMLEFNWETAFGYFTSAEEYANQRLYDKALIDFEKCLSLDPYFIPALEGLAELHYKRVDYNKALEYSKRALSIDTYTAKANYIFGLVMLKDNDFYNALEAFGLASKDMGYRALSYLKIAQIYIEKEDYDKALVFAGKSIKFNADSESANHVLVIAHRLKGNTKTALKMCDDLISRNPLNHKARFEKVFCLGNLSEVSNISNVVKNEFASETWLEIAITYYKLERNDEAMVLLQNAPGSVINDLWLAELNLKKGDLDKAAVMLQKVISDTALLTFPHRAETYEVLKKFAQENNSWKLNYYMALVLWSKNQKAEARRLFAAVGTSPGYAPFYLTKYNLFSGVEGYNPEPDLLKAKSLDPNNWRTSMALVDYYLQTNSLTKALSESKQAVDTHK